MEQVSQDVSRALFRTVSALSRAIESRDTYTAEHQRRVSQLSRRIAQEMALDASTIEGTRLGAALHDIGKIAIPAEILAKPVKLSPQEFALVKEHSRIGAYILENVEFPWPVADIVYQHHERYDGSGYPEGLRGDAIRIEAHIVGVADTVVTMTSHRPYRPARPLATATDEVSAHAGTLFHPVVAGACLAVLASPDATV